MPIHPVGQSLEIAGLECVVVDPQSGAFEPSGIVVLCHGFGAPGTDLVDCCRAMWELQGAALERVRFVFPAAPMSVDPSGLYDGRAWWPIDMERLNLMIARGEFRDLPRERPEMLTRRREQMTGLAGELLAESNLQPSSLVLGGFSQGAMLATDVALHLDSSPGGLIVWSGTLLNETEWRAAMTTQTKFPVYQSHGRYDPILPFAVAEDLHEALVGAGFDASFTPFDGGHEIPMPAMRGAASLVARVVAGR